jgi:hypothetical protein
LPLIGFTPKTWEDEPNLLKVLQGLVKPTSKTPVDAAALVDLEKRLSDYTRDVVEPLTPEGGDSVVIYSGSTDPAKRAMHLKVGTAAKPDETYGPPTRVSRTMKVAESAFSGDGNMGLGAITGVTVAAAGSEGQALGGVFGAVTHSSHVGAHSQADAFAFYAVGRSGSASTRTGAGGFILAQRNHVEGRATGVELTVENNASAAGIVLSNEYMNTMGFWVTPRGTNDSAACFVIGHPTSRVFKVGWMAQAGAVSEATLRDYSSSTAALDIRGSHSQALKVAAGAGIVQLGEGSEQSSRLSNPPDPQWMHVLHGTTASPVVIAGPSVKASRTEKLTKATIEAAEGVAGTDGLDSTPAIIGVSKGIEGSEVQATGVVGQAWNVSKFEGQFADACGLVGVGRCSGTGVALGSYMEAQTDAGATGKALATELRIRNLRASDTYVSGSPSSSMGLWVNVGGEYDAAAAMQVGGILGRKFDVGVGFNTNSLISSGIRDDSSSTNSIDIRGTHSNAAVRIKAGAGPVIIGADSLSTSTSQLLEIAAGGQNRNPLVKFTAGGAFVQQMVFNNAGGNFNIGQAGNAGDLMTGTVSGDAVINTGAKTLHLGRAGSAADIKVGGGVGFYGHAPAEQSAAYIQTYSATTREHKPLTVAEVSKTVATNASPYGYSTAAQANEIVTAINSARIDLANLKQLVNAVIDDLQANGLFQ